VMITTNAAISLIMGLYDPRISEMLQGKTNKSTQIAGDSGEFKLEHDEEIV